MKFSNFVTAAFVSGALGHDPLTPDKAEADITHRELQNILWNFQKIGRDNGGNRAFGFPGYNASMDFVLERAVKRFGRHYDTYVQKFTHLFEYTRKIALTGPDGENVYTVPFKYNVATPPEGITAELLDIPVDDARGTGCFPDQWEGIDATGHIALVKRGGCALADKMKNAKDHGASGVVIYSQDPGDIILATLGSDNIAQGVPMAPCKLEVGLDWSKRLAAGEKLEVTILVDSIVENRDSWNIISETKEGDPNNVVMLGAHLDSVPAGPGVNDDGTGSAFLLTLMESLKKYKGFKNKVRFAWWGAEESGLVGSLYYGQQLSEEEADKIRFYFNYDMIGSPNPYYAVYTDNEAHKVGAKPLLDYLQSKGKPAHYAKFGTSSDYVAFLKLGIPSSGLFTGAGGDAANGEPADPNYHTAKDDLNNIHWDALLVNSKAAARAAAKFALSLEGVPPRQKTSSNPQSRRAIFTSWAETAYIAEKSHSCGGNDNTY